MTVQQVQQVKRRSVGTQTDNFYRYYDILRCPSASLYPQSRSETIALQTQTYNPPVTDRNLQRAKDEKCGSAKTDKENDKNETERKGVDNKVDQQSKHQKAAITKHSTPLHPANVKTNDNANIAAVFSPNSAAMALSSLHQHPSVRQQPRQCFPFASSYEKLSEANTEAPASFNCKGDGNLSSEASGTPPGLSANKELPQPDASPSSALFPMGRQPTFQCSSAQRNHPWETPIPHIASTGSTPGTANRVPTPGSGHSQQSLSTSEVLKSVMNRGMEKTAGHYEAHGYLPIHYAPASSINNNKDRVANQLTLTNQNARLASNNTSLVTPTPKKVKLADGSSAPMQTPHPHMRPPPPQSNVHHPSTIHRNGQRGYRPSIHHMIHPHSHLLAAAHHPHMHVHPSAGRMHVHQSHIFGHGPHFSSTGRSHMAPLAPAAPTETNTTEANSAYSRKKKSLGVLAENFLRKYNSCRPGTEVGVDETAVELGVERRRIYDVVNILESVQLVLKKGKNTYTWLGGVDKNEEQFIDVFGKIQEQAIMDGGYAEDAKENGVILELPQNHCTKSQARDLSGRQPRTSSNCNGEYKELIKSDSSKSLSKLSTQFLQVFLVGYEILSLPDLSEKIQGTLSAEDYAAIGSSNSDASSPQLDDPKEFNRAAARGLKTKIRRLYDIANVFISVGLLEKLEPAGACLRESNSRRPNYQWAFRLSPKEIQERYAVRREESPNLAYAVSCTSDPSLSRRDGSAPTTATLAAPKADNKKQPFRPINANQWKSHRSLPFQRPRLPFLAPVSGIQQKMSDSFSSSRENASSQSAINNSNSPSNVPVENLDRENESSRVIFANIHQIGGAWEDHLSSVPSMPASSTKPGDADEEAMYI